MQLVDAIFLIGQMGDNTVVCAKEPFGWGSEAVIVELTGDYELPEGVKDSGYACVLDNDDIAYLLGQISRKRASRRTQAEFICHYAVHDAYPAWVEDLLDA